MVIFHSYVKLPEGIFPKELGFSQPAMVDDSIHRETPLSIITEYSY